jgi:hypothetical protein
MENSGKLKKVTKARGGMDAARVLWRRSGRSQSWWRSRRKVERR